MLEALVTEDRTLLPTGATFKIYGYSGNSHALFSITEALAQRKGLISNEIQVSSFAWGSSGLNLFEGSNTNFNRREIEMLFEAFNLLLNQNIIAPGIYGEGPFLPSFHVTEHGFACLKELKVLPYDYSGFLSQIKAIINIDEWVEHYVVEALKCFNAACYQSTNIMIGLASEKLTLNIIEAFENYLLRNEKSLTANLKFKVQSNFSAEFKKDIDKDWKISYKCNVFEEYLKNISIDKKLKGFVDSSARATFYQFIRLNRNEVSHPNEIVKDETETMLLFISFLKFVELQTEFVQELNKI
jgi:hypothetical protein